MSLISEIMFRKFLRQSKTKMAFYPQQSLNTPCCQATFFTLSVSSFISSILFYYIRIGLIYSVFSLRLLTHVGLVRQNVLILSEVSLYVERSKNLEKKCYHRAKKIHLPKGV